MRVLITGMGGALGTRVANLFGSEDRVEAVVGFDIDPPRRRLHRAEFHRVDPRRSPRAVRAARTAAEDRSGRLEELVAEVRPHVLVHLGVYEPHARTGPHLAEELTAVTAQRALHAAASTGALEQVVVRSGIEVYGRAKGTPLCPDEHAPLQPTCAFGRSLVEVERIAAAAGAGCGARVATVRLAPVVGPHFASPLGRYLRLPAVAVSAMGELPFSVVHERDAADALAAAVWRQLDGPVNVVADGAVLPSQVLRRGGRLPVPVLGPGWPAARLAAELLGAPVPDHVRELLVRGRTADAGQVEALLGLRPVHSTGHVMAELYRWADVEGTAVAVTA